MKHLLNGPYLLSLKDNSIIIAWEMDGKRELSLKYRNSRSKKQYVIPVKMREEDPSGKYQQDTYVCWGIVEDLQPNKEYLYEIYEGALLLIKGSFKTPKGLANTLKILTIGDSHSFETFKLFNQTVNKFKPDFMVHSGDISYGNGYQREQYENNWFKLLPEVLPKFPIYYVPGNHDDGIFFNSLFMLPQSQTVHKAKIGNSYSTDVAGIHFIMIDSNPWGLFEMNAINSGAKIDDKTQELIDETLKWLEKDLQSEEAQQAKWRIMVAHHPYTDVFNNKYLAPMAEKYRVDLVISGHVHYYTKSIAVNAEEGGETVYISQGTLQTPAARVEFAENGRLLEEFPEAVAIGGNNFGILEVTEEQLLYKMYGYNAQGKERLIDEIKLARGPKEILVEDVSLRRLDNLGNVEIRATLKNCHTGIQAGSITLIDNGEPHTLYLFGHKSNTHSILLNPLEKRQVIANYRAISVGEHHLSAGDASLEIMVYEPNQLTFDHFKVESKAIDYRTYIVSSAEITNNLDREIFTAVPYYVNQRVVESKNIFFRPLEKKYVQFIYQVEQRGEYNVTIGDQLGKTIKIGGGIRIIPTVQDKSGQGNIGLIHGTPRLINTKKGVELWLDKYTDYIEIPVKKEALLAKEGFTAVVNAAVQRLAMEDEMGHNPLMVRGKSVGWGATYLFRMVVERKGALKWGICHDITESSWQGGKVRLKKDTQYALSFDKEFGGKSYVDDEVVAQVAGIEPKERLRQWAEEPIFVGYSHIGHIIPELGQPKYFTHLSAKINQVRFYLKGLSDDKIVEMKEQPKNPVDDTLAIWYDFRDILTIGSHITEWRHPVIYKQAFKSEKKLWYFKQLRAMTSIPWQSSAKLIVEISDNKVHIKDSMEISLRDGTNYIDLSPLQAGQYIRLKTNLAATINAEGTFVSEVLEYQVTATDGVHFSEFYWSTDTDWQLGEFTGAVRIPPKDRFVEYHEYTDIIHG